MLDLGADAGLHLLYAFGHEVQLDEGVELAAQAGAHSHVPSWPSGFGPFVHALVASVAEDRLLVAVQQRAGHVQVVDVGRRAGHGV